MQSSYRFQLIILIILITFVSAIFTAMQFWPFFTEIANHIISGSICTLFTIFFLKRLNALNQNHASLGLRFIAYKDGLKVLEHSLKLWENLPAKDQQILKDQVALIEKELTKTNRFSNHLNLHALYILRQFEDSELLEILRLNPTLTTLPADFPAIQAQFRQNLLDLHQLLQKSSHQFRKLNTQKIYPPTLPKSLQS